MNPREEFVSVQEAANIMGLDRSRVGRLCREGRFPGAAKVGSSWIIPREAVLNHKPLPPGVKPRSERVKAEIRNFPILKHKNNDLQIIFNIFV